VHAVDGQVALPEDVAGVEIDADGAPDAIGDDHALPLF